MKKFYTTEGDSGTTGLLGKNRVSKNHPRIRAVGTVDEASAALGLARAHSDDELNQLVKSVQKDLYQIMTLLVLEEPDPDKFPDITSDQISWLEDKTDYYGSMINQPSGFIVPGDTIQSGAFGLARTIIRRAERTVVELIDQDLLISDNVLPYINRLSSLCFVLELYTSTDLPSQV
jgi:cob(I)alamin adenosyltransferase